MYPNVLTHALSFFAFGLAAIFLDGSALADTPTLEWDPNPEPTIAGYNVYVGTISGNYTRVADVGLQTTFPLTNLLAGVTHFFAVTAYNEERLESPFSDEVSYTPQIDGSVAIEMPSLFSVATNSITLHFSGYQGQQCWIVASSDLVTWELVHSLILVNEDLLEYTEEDIANHPMRFYRVVADQP